MLAYIIKSFPLSKNPFFIII